MRAVLRTIIKVFTLMLEHNERKIDREIALLSKK